MGSKTNPGKFDCHSKAEPDEPLFVLLGRDPTAYIVVLTWVALRRELDETEPEMLAEAEQCASAMCEWAIKRGKDPVAATFAHNKLSNYTLASLLASGRLIWGDQKLDAAGVLARLVVDFGKLGRYVRGATKEKCPQCGGSGEWGGVVCTACGGTGGSIDLRLVMGNILFSMIRWCDDLGLDPAECCRLAAAQQAKFAAENPER